MNVFCDTSVLVAAVLQGHVHHLSARPALDRIRRGEDVGYTSAHSLAEAFSVLSRMPTKPKLEPIDVLDILEHNIIPHFILTTLQPEDYPATIRSLAGKGLGGGRIYDLLHLRAAAKLILDRIYTYNVKEWAALEPSLASLICAPLAPRPPESAKP